MSAHVKSLGFISHQHHARGLRAAKQHVKYITADREHHRRKPELFNDKEDNLDRRVFFQSVTDQPQRGVIAHKMVLTISEDEQQRLGIDLRELVRDTMQRYQALHNVRLDWVSAIHDDEGHPHAHIVVRGYDAAGKQVGFYPKNIRDIQRIAEQEKTLQAERNQEQQQERDFLKELAEERTAQKVAQRVMEIELER